jgi:hypothetical protein
MPSLPELVIIDILNTIVDRVKQAPPARTDGKPLSSGLVYSQLVLGMPIDSRDYNHAWSPMGGATGGNQQAGVKPVAGQPDPALLASLQAAFKTSQLCNVMLQVTDDGSYLQYPVGRHLAFEYGGILSAMQPLPVPPPPPDVQKAIDDASAVLYTTDHTDPDFPVVGKSPLYARYTKNALAYALAKSNYALNMAKTLADPATGNMWPQLSAPFQAAVDEAWDTFKTQGAEKVERALAVIESQGINMQQAQIAAAKKQMDIWSLGLAGVPTNIPYSYVEPSEWSDPTVDDIGFEQLQILRKSEEHYASTVTDTNRSMYWNNQQTSTSQNAHASGFLGIDSASESSSNADQHSANGDSSSYVYRSMNNDSFKDLEVNLEWALVSIYRPWLISDLFYMNNWYIQGERANAVSDGKIQTQLRASGPLLPMIPQQMLVVRNLTIKSSTWGDTGAALQTLYGGDQASANASQSSAQASGSIGLAPFGSGGGGFSHTNNQAAGQGSGYTAKNATSYTGTTFDGTTLTINGAQVIAFLSDIVPPAPTIDDPALPKPKSAATANTIAGPAGVVTPVPVGAQG